MKRFLTIKSKSKSKNHPYLQPSNSATTSTSVPKEPMFTNTQEQEQDLFTPTDKSPQTSSGMAAVPPLPQRSKSATLRRILSRSFTRKASEEADPFAHQTQTQEQTEPEPALQSCKGRTFSLHYLGSSTCDRHLRECPGTDIEGCKHDCGSCKKKRQSRRENQERLVESMGVKMGKGMGGAI